MQEKCGENRQEEVSKEGEGVTGGRGAYKLQPINQATGKSKVTGEVLLAFFKQTKPYVQNVCV